VHVSGVEEGKVEDLNMGNVQPLAAGTIAARRILQPCQMLVT
jgi:hypothetical protein